ncbi:MAG: HAD family phosphatase [Bacteroidota bacterium]|nr:HAD family phosphatase [Bacteroidota bacterium]
MKIEAVLFDLDGVVFDTENHYTKFWTSVGKRYFPEKEDFASVIKGHSIEDILSQYFAEHKEDWKTIETELYEMEKQMTFPYIEGVKEFILSLQNEGIKTCLVTSSDAIKMQTVVEKCPEIKTFFPLMVIATDVKHAKPAPDCYLLGARKCGVRAEACLVFEDSFAGIEAGQKAGMEVIALSTTNPKEALLTKVKKVIKDFSNFSLQEACV